MSLKKGVSTSTSFRWAEQTEIAKKESETFARKSGREPISGAKTPRKARKLVTSAKRDVERRKTETPFQKRGSQKNARGLGTATQKVQPSKRQGKHKAGGEKKGRYRLGKKVSVHYFAGFSGEEDRSSI